MSKMHDLINNNDNNLLDNEKPLNSDEKQRILNTTIKKIANTKNNKISKKKFIIGILVATMMIGTVAMASEYFESNLDKTFLNFFGINKNDSTLDIAGADIKKTTSNNGLDFTVRQTLGDEHTLYAIIDVVAPDNVKIPENCNFNDSTISLSKNSSSGWYFQDIEDDNPNDNKASYLLSYNTQSKLTNNNTITICLKDFGYYSDKINKFIPLVKGKWELSWNLKYKNLTQTFNIYHFVKENNYKSIITSIKISPISISANLIGDHYDNFIIKGIIMKDGTTYSYSSTNINDQNSLFISGSSSSSFLKGYTSCDFSKIINVDDVKSIIIGDEVIDINQ